MAQDRRSPRTPLAMQHQPRTIKELSAPCSGGPFRRSYLWVLGALPCRYGRGWKNRVEEGAGCDADVARMNAAFQYTDVASVCAAESWQQDLGHRARAEERSWRLQKVASRDRSGPSQRHCGAAPVARAPCTTASGAGAAAALVRVREAGSSSSTPRRSRLHRSPA